MLELNALICPMYSAKVTVSPSVVPGSSAPMIGPDRRPANASALALLATSALERSNSVAFGCKSALPTEPSVASAVVQSNRGEPDVRAHCTIEATLLPRSDSVMPARPALERSRLARRNFPTPMAPLVSPSTIIPSGTAPGPLVPTAVWPTPVCPTPV